jgi:phage/plasmid-like protein (TIGR03299 family)
MAHEIDGKLAVYARTPAWHGIGVVTADLFTAEEALTVLNPNAEEEQYRKVPAYAKIGDEFVVSGEQIAIVRKHPETGEWQVISFMGRDYGNLQPRDLFGFTDEVVAGIGGAHYAAAAFLRNGRQIILTVDAGAIELDPQGRKDVIKSHLFVSNSWDGSWACRAKWVNGRIECANMAAWALRGSTNQIVNGDWNTKHTANVMNRVQAAREVLGLQKSYNDLFYAQAEELIQTKLTDAVYDRLLADIFLVDETTKERDQEAMNQVKAVYELSPSQANLYGTMWGGLNAITEYHDWRTKVRATKTGGLNERRFVRQFDDTTGLKQRAWDVVWAAHEGAGAAS